MSELYSYYQGYCLKEQNGLVTLSLKITGPLLSYLRGTFNFCTFFGKVEVPALRMQSLALYGMH